MADMTARIKLNYLMDFYGPLLTPHRQEVMRLYCEEDLSQQEIADQLSITRQGVSDAIANSRRQLEAYEAKLRLVERYRQQSAAAQHCLEALDRLHPIPEDITALEAARSALQSIITDK